MADVKWSVSNDREDDEAYIENERGVECVQIQRTNGPALTRGEFDVIVDLIAAAPEMLAALRDLRATLEALTGWRELDGTQIDQLIASDGLHYLDKVIAKAEPVREVRRKVEVTVEVTLDVQAGTDDATLAMIAVDAVRDGGGAVTAHKVIG
jgi:hypothetical protein